MAVPDTTVVKQWCRIDGTEFDLILPVLIASATKLASHECAVDYTTTTMPDGVKSWVCAQVAFWIANPESGSSNRITPSPFLAGLLDPYRSYTWTAAT
jgi:hypothetical protein